MASLLKPNLYTGKNRFVIQVALDEPQKVYLPNPGRLRELLLPGTTILLRRAQLPTRKTGYDAIAVRHKGLWVCIDSRIPNQVILQELLRGRIPKFKNYTEIRPEYQFGDSRFDFLLEDGHNCMLEVKGCTLVRKKLALFPDAPTERGTRHLNNLVRAVQEGYRACILFLVQRPDAESFSPNDKTDPDFAEALRYALASGVEAIAYTSTFTKRAILMKKRIPIRA